MHMREKFDKDDRLIGTISSDRGEYPCPYRKFRPSLFTRVYIQLPDYDKLSQMWALSRKRPQEAVILS